MQRKLTEQGLRYLEEGRFKQAAEVLLQLIQKFPNNADAHHMLGIIELERKNFDAAYILLNTSIEIDRKNPVFYTTLATLEMQRKNYQQAELALSQAVTLNPQKIEYRYNLAHYYLLRFEFHKALELYYEILCNNPNHYLSMRGITISYLFSNECDIALEHAKNWSREYYDQCEPHYYKGLCLQASDNIYGALKTYDFALKLDPINQDLITAIATCYAELGNYILAEKYLYESLGIENININALQQLGHVKYEQGKYLEAKRIFEQVQNIDNNFSDTVYCLGKVALAERDYSKAIDFFIVGNSMEPMSLTYKNTYAETLLRINDFSGGWREYNKNIEHPKFTKHIDKWSGEKISPVQWLLIWFPAKLAEQQQIMLCNVLPGLEEFAKNVIIKCQPKLANLLKQSFPGYRVVSEIVDVDADFQCPITMLPLYINIEPRRFLKADKLQSDNYKNKYTKTFPQKKFVGLSWDSFKQIREYISDAYPTDRYQLIALQNRTIECEDIFFDDDIDYSNIETERLAAIVSSMDAVIGPDNLITHIAGSLAINASVLLPRHPDWYWFDDFSKNIWYIHLNTVFTFDNLCTYDKMPRSAK